jgi:CHASE2 domain-containing sensor protein
MLKLNRQLLFFLLLSAVVGVLIAIDRPSGREVLGLFSGAALGGLLAYGYQRWVQRWFRKK